MRAKYFAIFLAALLVLPILSSLAIAHPGPYRDRLEGFDLNKLDDPNVQTIKYRAARVFEHYPPDSSRLWDVVRELRAAGLNPTRLSFDEIDFNDGNSAIDVIRASDVDGGGEAWQWLVKGLPGHSPSLRTIFPNGGEVFDHGSTIDVSWTSRTTGSSTIPSRNFITIQFIKSTGERFTFFSTLNDGSEPVVISSSIPAGLYRARTFTTIDVPPDLGRSYIVDDLSDNFFTIRTASANNPPTISSCTVPSSPVTVGSTATITYSISDPDGDAVTVSVNWGDGTSSAGGSSSASHVYASAGTFSVTITATDSRGATASRSCGTITVISSTNNPPIISSCTPPSGSITTGSAATITYTVSDPDNDPVTVTVNWGDGTSSTGGAGSASHVYSSAGTYSVTITATDSRGASTVRTCGTITVTSTTNNPPVISSCAVPSSPVTVGSTASIAYSVSDPNNDPVTVTVSWGDGTTSAGGSSSASHVYASIGTFSVIVTTTDSRGATASRSCGTIRVTAIPNNPPTISSCTVPSSPVTVGSTATITYLISDPDGDAVTVSVSWGDGTTTSGGAGSASHVYSSQGTYSVTITAADGRGATNSRFCGTIVVLPAPPNNPPVISSCTPPSGSITTGSTATIAYTVSDPDNDPVTVTVNWGDGTSSTGGAGSASHVYSAVGTYTVIVTATDSRGASTVRTCGTITVTSTTNNPPVISSCALPSSPVVVGSAATITYAVVDPDSDPVTVSVSWGDGTSSAGGATSASHAYASAGTFSIIVTATDSRGATASRSCGSITITSTPQPPSTSVCPKLRITDVDAKVDGKSDNNLRDNDEINKNAAPGSRLELRVTVENLYNRSENNDLEDVQITATIEGIDNGDDIEEESREFDLSPQDDKTVTFRFQLPASAEEGNYDIRIEAEGDDEQRRCPGHEDEINLGFEVEKEKHKMAFTKLSLNKAAINCSESFVLSYILTNLGSEDEESAYVEIRNDDLGLNFVQKGISVGSEAENNKISKSHTLKVSGNSDGAYPLAVSVYSDDGKLQDSETVNIELRNCPAASEEKTSKEKVASRLQTTTIQVTGTDAIEEVYSSSSIIALFAGKRANLMLLALSTFIFSMFLLFVAIVALVKAEEN